VSVSTRARTLPLTDLGPKPKTTTAGKSLKVVTGRAYIHPGTVIEDLTRKDLEGVRVTLVNMPLREAAPPNNAPLGPAILATVLRNWARCQPWWT
jgi:hypothetical protein